MPGHPVTETLEVNGRVYPVSRTLVRRVWAVLSEDASLSVREIAQRLDYWSHSGIGFAIRVLERVGYVEADRAPGGGRRSRGRRVVVPFRVLQ